VNRQLHPTKDYGSARKTLPAVRFRWHHRRGGLPNLPEETQLAMSDIAGAVRAGLMAMSIAAEMAVMAAMFDAEIARACGPKGKHDPQRAAVRHGHGRGSVTSGQRRAAVTAIGHPTACSPGSKHSDYADLFATKPLLCKGSAAHIGIIRTSVQNPQAAQRRRSSA
jgi:hypothetical protein